VRSRIVLSPNKGQVVTADLDLLTPLAPFSLICHFINFLNDMDLRDIEYFSAIAEHGHLGRAAEALGLGQPALSISLRRLENAVQAKLVKRTPKGVVLTTVGTALLTHVRRLKLAKDDLTREVADLGRGLAGDLRLGTGPAISEGFLPHALSVLLKDAPKVKVSVTVTAATDTLLSMLANGDLDIVVNHSTRLAHPDLVMEPLWEDEFVVYASRNHRLARRSSATLNDLVQERWASTADSAFLAWQSLQRNFEERGLPQPHITLVSESAMLRFRTVATTDLLGVGSRRIVEANAAATGLKVIRVRDVNWVRRVVLAYRKDGYLPPAGQSLVVVLKEHAKCFVTERR